MSARKKKKTSQTKRKTPANARPAPRAAGARAAAAGAKPKAKRATAAPRNATASRSTTVSPRTPSLRAAGARRTGSSRRRRPVPLHVMSDSTGNLAQHMLTAFLTQFPHDAFELHRHHFIQTEQKLERAMDDVARLGGIVFHAVVHAHFKEMIEERCRSLGVAYCDLTGRFVEFLSAASGIEPQPDIGRLHHVHAASYNARIKAVEFTLEHDDGLGLDTIHEADIVLTGISRTSKTPTSIYLAQQGFRVANVALAMAVAPPAQLLALKERVVGLTINPAQLVEIRTNRNASWRMGDTSYNDPEHVNREILWSRRLFRDQGWPMINVTDRAIEETAVRCIDLLGLKTP